MPYAITASGLVVKTQAELIQEFSDGMKLIYGDDINLSPDTPDGQMMMLYIQPLLDMSDLLKQIFNSMDPDAAFGTTLDRRVSFNGIQRKDGTHTTQFLDITTSQALTLFGIDDGEQVQEIYKVSDDVGNNWLLVETFNAVGVDTYNLLFRAEFPGAILTTPNTINVPVSIVLGVETINNPTVQYILGIDEESDFQLKIRRQKSVGLGSQGYDSSLEAALENIDGITYAIVIENALPEVSDDGLPPNSIWVIVEGTADDALIAQAIYVKRNAGPTMVGDKSSVITQRSGIKKTIRWDLVETEDLFIKMNIDSIDGYTAPNLAAIRTQLPNLLTPNVNEKINVNTIAKLVQQIDSNALATNIGLGKTPTGPFSSVIEPSERKNRFLPSSSNTILLAMTLTPSEIVSIAPTDTRLFVVAGGFGAIVWTFQANNSGATLSAGGLYTAGAATGTTDVIRATDSLGNSVDANIGVN